MADFSKAVIVPGRRPLIGMALFFIAGTLGGLLVDNAPLVLPAAVLFVLTALISGIRQIWRGRAAGLRGWSVLSAACFYLGVFATAWFAAQLHVRNPSRRLPARLMERPRETVELSGVIAGDPVMQRVGAGTIRRWHYPLRLHALRRLEDWQTARGMVAVVAEQDQQMRAPQYGDYLRLSGVLVDRALFAEVADEFSGRRPLQQKIARERFRFYADATAPVLLAQGRGSRLMALCLRGRHAAAGLLERGLENHPDVSGLMRALLLGCRGELRADQRRLFIRAGVYHIFAISGQHVAIVALFLLVLVRAQRVCRQYWFWFVAPALILFTMASGSGTSAVRGCLMALLVFLGPLLGRRPDLPSALALAAILIIGADPAQILDYGFILSFAVVLGLITLAPALLAGLRPWFLPDPYRLQAESGWMRAARVILRAAAFLVVASLAAWLVSTPLIARWFNLVAPIALLTNLVAVPLATLLMLAGSLAVLAGLVWPALGAIFNFAALALVALLQALIGCMIGWPGAYCFVAAPPVGMLLVWFGTLAAWLCRHVWGRVWLLGVLVLSGAWSISFGINLCRVRLDCFNLGGNGVCLVQAPGRNFYLVHAGAFSSAHQLTRVLQRRGVNRLRGLILPVADAAHAGGALEVMRNFDVAELWCVSTNARSPVFQQALAGARALGRPIIEMTRRTEGVLGGNLEWRYDQNAGSFAIMRANQKLQIVYARPVNIRPGRDEIVGANLASKATGPSIAIRCLEPGELILPDDWEAQNIHYLPTGRSYAISLNP